MSGLAVWAATFLLASTDRFVENSHFHVRVEAPFGWTFRQQSSFPGLIAVMKHRDGAEMTLSAQTVSPTETPRSFAERNRKAMEAMRMQTRPAQPVPSALAVVVDAASRDQKLRLRQYYAIHRKNGFVLTLTAPANKLESYLRDFEAAWRSIVHLEDDEESPAPE